MNRRPITYNYLKTIANGSIHFHAFSYQYTGYRERTGYEIYLGVDYEQQSVFHLRYF